MADFNRSVPNIITENVQVRYSVPTSEPGRRSKGLPGLGSLVTGRGGTTTVRALRGVNLVAREGEMVGIVGANGSGKSTLLRNIAGVEQPDRGRILARYQPLLLGVSAALQPSLSGIENVRLGCLAMGLSPAESADATDYVVELSALGKAIHRPMGTYSSGMGARLRFAIALAARPKILLIDEALSTGDATFAERSESAMKELLTEAGTVLLVNHAAKVIQELCSRAIWMHQGEVLMDGPAESVAEKYRWWAWNVAQGKQDVANKLLHDVVKNAVREEINILETDLARPAVPRHVNRPVKGKRYKSSPRHADRSRHDRSARADAEPHEAPRDYQIWPDTPSAPNSKTEFPTFSLGETAPPIGNSEADPPALRLRPKKNKVILRAADPKDRASSVAAESDLTNRRLSSKSQQLAEGDHSDRRLHHGIARNYRAQTDWDDFDVQGERE